MGTDVIKTTNAPSCPYSYIFLNFICMYFILKWGFCQMKEPVLGGSPSGKQGREADKVLALRGVGLGREC